MTTFSNFPTMLPFNKSSNTVIQNGNLYMPGASYDSTGIGSVGVSSGKWYYELRVGHNYGSYFVFGWVCANKEDNYITEISTSMDGALNWSQLGSVVIDGSYVVDPSSPSFYNTSTKVVGCALDLDNNKVYWHGNNTYINDASGNAGNPSAGTYGFSIPAALQGQIFYPMVGTNKTGAPSNTHVNFGQDSSFQGETTGQNNADSNGFGDFYYAPPTSFLSLCSSNMPTSSDIDPGETDSDYPQKNFNVLTYSGGTSGITGLGFQPDLVWIKRRNGGQGNGLFDSSRGTSKVLQTDSTGAENTSSGLTSFDSDGYTMGTYYNQSGNTYVSWCWKAGGGTTSSNSDGNVTSTVQVNTKSKFSIVQWSGTGSAGATVGHGLGAVPKFIIVKNRDYARNWACYHVDYNSSGQRALLINTGGTDNSNYWNGTQPTSSVFSLGTETEVNRSGDNMVAYCWANTSGMQHFGSYYGNGSSDGPYIATGFRPRMLFTMRTDSASGFRVRDTERQTFNPSTRILWWTYSQQEYNSDSSSGYNFDIFSNGFKIRTSSGDFNANNSLYVYGAWGDVPAKYSNAF